MLDKSLVLLHQSSSLLKAQSSRCLSILSKLISNPVLLSSSKDIYTNLALEHWLFSHARFADPEKLDQAEPTTFKTPIVLLWTDEPCIVIGRHQNPWIESTIGIVDKYKIQLARRHSGGGCVYHDENNINISIIGHRKLFEKRQENLEFLASVIDKNYGVKCETTKRHDLIHTSEGLKITGSAAKIGRDNCYHHFTLLVDTDKEVMEVAIRQQKQDLIQTNSSLSNRSRVVNLKELNSTVTVDRVITDLVHAYSQHYSFKEVPKRSITSGDSSDIIELNKLKQQLMSWEWIYGMTPQFRLERILKVIDNGVQKDISFIVHINRGIFERFELKGELSNCMSTESLESLVGTRFTYKDAMTNIVRQLQVNSHASPVNMTLTCSQHLLGTFLLQMIHECNY